jgi:hypothetical protein
LDSLSAGDLTIELSQDDGLITCTWRGKSTERQPGKVLGPYFEGVLGAASDSAVPVEMHFEELDHFNSSTITALIRLIQSARTKNVRLVVVYNQELKWQRLSFDALRVFDKNDQLFELRAA